MQTPKRWVRVIAPRSKIATELPILKSCRNEGIILQGVTGRHSSYWFVSIPVTGLKARKPKGRAKKHLVFTACSSVTPNFDYCHQYKALIMGTEEIFGDYLSVFELAGDARDTKNDF